MNIPVIYQDEWLLVVDKPSGLLVIPSPKNEKRTLTSILNDDANQKNLSYRLHPCHRLDRETSGLMIYAKGKSIQKKMMQLFAHKKVRKTYLAFIQGNPRVMQGEIKYPVEGKLALTSYRVIGKRKDFSIVEAMPITGRTNQIRIHFKNIGHPLVGETRFAFRRDFSLKAKRLCLHAKSLEFIHPVTHKNIMIDSEIAKELKDFLSQHPG
jgi:23S rRNA pseudouridine1911/1915/1917 synthase